MQCRLSPGQSRNGNAPSAALPGALLEDHPTARGEQSCDALPPLDRDDGVGTADPLIEPNRLELTGIADTVGVDVDKVADRP